MRDDDHGVRGDVAVAADAVDAMEEEVIHIPLVQLRQLGRRVVRTRIDNEDPRGVGAGAARPRPPRPILFARRWGATASEDVPRPAVAEHHHDVREMEDVCVDEYRVQEEDRDRERRERAPFAFAPPEILPHASRRGPGEHRDERRTAAAAAAVWVGGGGACFV